MIATKIHKIVREVTNNPDAYRAMKEREMTLARELYPELSLQTEAPNPRRGKKGDSFGNDALQSYLKLATAANAIDFFREPDSIKEDISRSVSFVINNSGQFEAKLKDAGKVLYLADNAGELYFDLPLVKQMKQFAQVIYVVKPSPVQDDLTVEDVRDSGLEGEFGNVISTGIASPGIVFSLASAQFKREFESADLIFAKGMGIMRLYPSSSRKGSFSIALRPSANP